MLQADCVETTDHFIEMTHPTWLPTTTFGLSTMPPLMPVKSWCMLAGVAMRSMVIDICGESTCCALQGFHVKGNARHPEGAEHMYGRADREHVDLDVWRKEQRSHDGARQMGHLPGLKYSPIAKF